MIDLIKNNSVLTKYLLNPVKANKLGEEIKKMLELVFENLGAEEFKKEFPLLSNFIKELQKNSKL